MTRSPQKLWARGEVVAVLSLYCQIPFGAIHHRNPRVKALAEALGRTPSSVALKLVNLASLDPKHRKRGVSGMSNVSRLDRTVWDEFYGKWEILADTITSDTGPSGYDRTGTGDQWRERGVGKTEAVEERLVRRGQQFFRHAVVSAYELRCCITELSTLELLRASHILPWSASIDSRLDPCNGLCLNALHDAAFDRGLITLDSDLRLVVSPYVREGMSTTNYNNFFGQYEGHAIRMPERFAPRVEYLSFHRENIFKG